MDEAETATAFAELPGARDPGRGERGLELAIGEPMAKKFRRGKRAALRARGDRLAERAIGLAVQACELALERDDPAREVIHPAVTS
ncbi:MAG TPA: hypothetical protein VKE69_02850 [Planctomycetota bacterium]|nr:hypothetical protein [Planctomycetota bacterium]